MLENPERVEQFQSEIAEMKLPDASSSRDRTYLRAGVALMVLGTVLAVFAFIRSNGTTNALDQRDSLIIAVIGLTVAVIGTGLFLRYSIAQFLRFWMARLSWEQTAATDRLIEAMRDGS